MATLQKIRNQGALLVGIIFLALAAFLLGDAFRSGMFGKDSQVVGVIDGQEVNIVDFQRKVEEVAEVHKMTTGNMQMSDQAWNQVRTEVWRDFEYNMVFEPTCEELGLTVTSDELFDMVQGNNIHPALRSMFTNPETGSFDREAVINFLKAVDKREVTSQQYVYWKYLESQIKRERLVNKYNALIGKGMYITSLEAKNSFAEKNTQVDFEYVKIPYTIIEDDLVKVSDTELKAYYNAHKENYKIGAYRNVEYVVLPITATESDNIEAQSWIKEIKNEFATVGNNQQFVNINSDVPFNDSYSKKDDLTGELAEFAFTRNIGDVFGPQKDENSFSLVKIDDRKMLADSVEARHILLNPQELGGIEVANRLADSLKTIIESGKAKFADIAEEYSADKTSAIKGGDLGWFGRNQMIQPFSDTVFNGTEGKLYLVTTQFGVHIIEPTAMGKKVEQVRLAKLVRNIQPSSKTEDAVYAKASQLVTKSSIEDYKSIVKDLGLSVRHASLEEAQEEVVGLEDSRAMIRAAYKTEKINDFLIDNEGSSIFRFGESFVVARLSGMTEKGYSSFESVKSAIERAVVKTKKVEQIAAKVNGNDLATTANQLLGTQVANASNVHFDMYSIPALGFEPVVLGTLTALPKDAVSKPIEGTTAIFITKNTNILAARIPSEEDIVAEQIKLSSILANRVNYQSFEELMKTVKTEDNRVKFY